MEQYKSIRSVAGMAGGMFLVAAAACAAWYYMRVGLDFADEPYEIMNSLDPRNTPMAPLSAWLTGVLAHWFNPSGLLLGYRVLAYVVACTGIAAGCAIFRMLTRASVGATLAVGALAMGIGTVHLNVWIYGWDAFSNASLALVACVGVMFMRNPDVRIAAMLGGTAAMAVLFRVPNIVIVPVATLFVALASRRAGERQRALAAFVIAFVGVTAIVLAVIYGGNPFLVVSAWRANQLGDHDNLLYDVADGFIWYLPALCLALMMFLSIRYVLSSNATRAWKVAGVVAAVLLFGLAQRITIWYSNTVSFMAESLVIVPLLYVVLSRRSNLKPMRPVALLLFFCGLAAIAGSNTGFHKFLCIPIIPAVCALVACAGSRALRLWFAGMAVCLMVVGADMRSRRMYMDVGVPRATATVDVGIWKGLRTSPQMACYASSAVRAVEQLRAAGYEPVVMGSGINRFGWEYMAGSRFEPLRHQWSVERMSADDPVYASAVCSFIDTLRSDRVVVLVPAPFEATIDNFAFKSVDRSLDSLLSTRMRMLPASTPRLHMYVREP